MHRFALLAIFAASSAIAEPVAPAAHPPAISDLKIGLANFAQQQVYQEATRVTYHENGSCKVGAVFQPCLQWGLRFGFRDIPAGAALKCKVAMTQASQPVASLPESRTRTDYEWTYRFPKAQGTAFVPQYIVRNPGEAGYREIAMKCSVAGNEAIGLTFTVDMPQ
ncbi:MAG: hypothetical protein K0R03_1693 [Moraxellaceae bacterium]|jgi:hypothetical protein|nr:hypothetical protein [Moraxellaceae bacterium]